MRQGKAGRRRAFDFNISQNSPRFDQFARRTFNMGCGPAEKPGYFGRGRSTDRG